ncbi:unnamed protein product [Owenia fusiformis]|uniref:Uncharacterized protein n=1 Tax=Owenia fusiformis TaxID=6347 RepID=A0A8J1UTU5_OWEFU|nr:unnamed protein product [Owenia fusiformis]
MSKSKLRQNEALPNPASHEDILSAIDSFEPSPVQERNVMITSQTENGMVLVEDATVAIETGKKTDMLNSQNSSRRSSHSNSYSAEWDRMFHCPNYLKDLKLQGLEGNLRSSRFRSVCWKLYLETLPENIDDWISETRQRRADYDHMRRKYIINPRSDSVEENLVVNNPLSQIDESPWNRFFLDNELRLTIKQDVVRTFPEIEFFKEEKIEEMMVNILFCHCRKHHKLSYKQGMHELLAPFIFVLHCDHQAFEHATELEQVSELVKEVLNPQYLEHDAYALFCKVMDTVEPWYVSRDIYPAKPSKTEKFTKTPFTQPSCDYPTNVIVTKLNIIQSEILSEHDMELYNHLEKYEIAPQVYGIRWIRLLFGREFPMQDLLVMWDALFAESTTFDLVDYVFVAMLLYIRDILLESDYPTCMTTLMRYPPVGDVHFFVEKALHLQNPQQYPKPHNYTYQKLQHVRQQSKQKDASAGSWANMLNPAANMMKSGLTSLTKNIEKMNTGISAVGTRPANLTYKQNASEPAVSPIGKSSSAPYLESESGDTVVNGVQRKSSMNEHARPSASSMARLESKTPALSGSLQNLDQMTPEDPPPSGSPFKYATLPSRAKINKKKSSKEEVELQQNLALVQGQLNESQAMCTYCAGKMDEQIGKIQTTLLSQKLKNEDELLLALAGLKQVRDILKGTLKFSQNLLHLDELEISDNHYKQEPRLTTESSKLKSQMFYMSSGNNTPSISSPEEALELPLKRPPKPVKDPVPSIPTPTELKDFKDLHTDTEALKFGDVNKNVVNHSEMNPFHDDSGEYDASLNPFAKNSDEHNPFHEDEPRDDFSMLLDAPSMLQS